MLLDPTAKEEKGKLTLFVTDSNTEDSVVALTVLSGGYNSFHNYRACVKAAYITRQAVVAFLRLFVEKKYKE